MRGSEPIEGEPFEAVQRLVEARSVPAAIPVTLRLSNVQLTVNGAMAEGIFDIALPHHQSLGCHHRQKATSCNQAADGCVHVTVVNTGLLNETLGNKACLVRAVAPISKLAFDDPLGLDSMPGGRREGVQVPSCTSMLYSASMAFVHGNFLHCLFPGGGCRGFMKDRRNINGGSGTTLHCTRVRRGGGEKKGGARLRLTLLLLLTVLLLLRLTLLLLTLQLEACTATWKRSK